MTALKDHPSPTDLEPVQPEALIEEARRRQRRRRASLAGLVAALGVAAAIYGLTSGGGSPKAPAPIARGDGSGQRLTAAWQQLTAPGGYIQPGAQITSVIRWHGELIAAGGIDGWAHISGLGCSRGCNPVIWTSNNGRRWRAVFAASTTGSLQEVSVVAVGNALLLFNSHEETQVWRSTNGRTWREVELPSGMDGMPTLSVASNGRRVVATFSSRFPAGPGGKFNPVWISTNGLHWRRGLAAQPVNFKLVSTGPGGFVGIGYALNAARTAIVHWFALRSPDGVSWAVTPLSARDGGNELMAAGSHGIVLYRIGRPQATVRFLRSSGGRGWVPATFAGSTPTNRQLQGPAGRVLLSLPGGFVAFGATNRYIWRSTDGRVWRRLTVASEPPAAFKPWAVFVDGNSLLVIEMPQRTSDGVPGGATTIWQLKLSGV